ncbi:hypothetical protein FRC06_003556, partial [Ceratobasidium sp. 370]
GDDQDDAAYQLVVRTIVRQGFILSENVGGTIHCKHAKSVNETYAQNANIFLRKALEQEEVGDDQQDGHEFIYQDIPVPTADDYVKDLSLKAQVAKELFGRGGVVWMSGHMHSYFAEIVACLLGRIWESMRRSLRNKKNKSKRLMQEFDGALEVAWMTPSPVNLKRASRMLHKWRLTAVETMEVEDELFKQRVQEFERLWCELGFTDLDAVDDAKSRKGKAKGKTRSLLLSEEEMFVARQRYLEIMGELGDEDETMAFGAIQPPNADLTPVDLIEGTDDIGVAQYADWVTPKAWAHLGLPNAVRFPFARTSPIDSGADGDQPPHDVTPKWHQIIRVIAMLERACTERQGDDPLPTMLCDDVGLGKTLQLIGLISMVAHLYEQQQRQEEEGKRLPTPPFMAENNTPFLAGLRTLPNLPHIVVVPRALSAQWIAQIKAFTEPGSFNVLLFCSAQGDLDEYQCAIGPNGEKAYRTIIVAELPVHALGIRCKLRLTIERIAA